MFNPKNIFAAIVVSLSLAGPVGLAYATTSAPTTTPAPQITTPAPTCPDGSPVWEAGQETFLAQVTSAGGKLVGIKENDAGLFVVVDIRGMNDYNNDPAFLFVMQFDKVSHCFVTSGFFDPQVIQDVLGIVLVSE